MLEEIRDFISEATEDYPYTTFLYARPIGVGNSRNLWIRDEDKHGVNEAVGVPEELALVDRASLLTFNSELARLQAEVESLKAHSWQAFHDEVMRRAQPETDATVYEDRIAYHMKEVAGEWGGSE